MQMHLDCIEAVVKTLTQLLFSKEDNFVFGYVEIFEEESGYGLLNVPLMTK